MIKRVFFSAILLALQANATQIIASGPDGEISGFVASHEISRIKIIGDRIKSVKTTEGTIDIMEDTKLGEVYIRPRTKDPINAFITTEAGYTYKFLLIPKAQPSEQIFIKNEESILQSMKSKTQGFDSFKQEVISFIKDMRSDKSKYEKDGFEQGNLVFKEIRSARGNKFTGKAFKVTTKTETPEFLSYESIADKATIAISFDSEVVSSKEPTYVYIIKGE